MRSPSLHLHAGRVTQQGGLILRDRAAWDRAVARYKGRAVVVSLKSAASQQKATASVHGYYRAVVLPTLAEEWGWSDVAELHYRLKEKHLPSVIPIERWPYRKLGKVEMREPPSLADLTGEQMSAFLQLVIDHATEERVHIPAPRAKATA